MKKERGCFDALPIYDIERWYGNRLFLTDSEWKSGIGKGADRDACRKWLQVCDMYPAGLSVDEQWLFRNRDGKPERTDQIDSTSADSFLS